MTTPRALVIAIDGPSGAGKGTVSRTIAEQLQYRHIDTGAMYRGVAWQAVTDGVDLTDSDRLAAIASAAVFTFGAAVTVNGHDVTAAIRTPGIDRAAAVVAQHPAVRTVLVDRQRGYGRDGGVVMEGRDIGTVVFPEADVKIYLDASAEERARRRAADQSHAASREGGGVVQVAQALEARDRADRTRAASPLTRAGDAIYIDTTGVSVQEVVARVMAAIDERQTLAR